MPRYADESKGEFVARVRAQHGFGMGRGNRSQPKAPRLSQEQREAESAALKADMRRRHDLRFYGFVTGEQGGAA